MKTFRFEARLEEDPPVAADLWALGCRGMQQDGPEVVAWFDEEVPLPVEGAWGEADDTDWLAAYQESLEPVPIGTLVVAPTHREVLLTAGQRVLWLDPGMAFGTGHHETTRMALASLEDTPLVGRRVLDVGAGSGILAIAADLLGAASAVGLDIDPATVPVARENARLNRSRARFDVGTLDEWRADDEADVLVANLFAELHARLLPAYDRALETGGTLLLTGILAEREELVTAAIPPTLRLTDRMQDGTWVLLRLERS